jgi:hypothetical protein
MRSSTGARCPVWEWIRHSRSLPKSAPRQPVFRPHSTFLPGSAPVLETKKARGSVPEPPLAEGQSPDAPHSDPKDAAFDLDRGVSASIQISPSGTALGDTIKPSGRLPIASADSSGFPFIAGCARGTRTGRPREFETSTNDEHDPPTPKPWLWRRTAGTEPCIGSEEFSTLLGTRQKRPGFGPALFSAVQLKVLRTPAAAQAAGRAVCQRRC